MFMKTFRIDFLKLYYYFNLLNLLNKNHSINYSNQVKLYKNYNIKENIKEF